jgi:hypothetical protein
MSATMAVIMEQEQANDIRRKTTAPHDQYQLRMRDLLRLEESLYRLEEDGKTQCNKENTVYERTQGLSSLPLLHMSANDHKYYAPCITYAIGVHLASLIRACHLDCP